ncbi:MAG: hypothetical protein MUC36_09235 [Planctomycetes bacterium]|nr:hypothetical protein [Planctomycetota bacterium]
MHRILCLPLVLVACNSSPLNDPTLTPKSMSSGLAWKLVKGGSQSFELRSERIVDGRTLPAGTVVHGLLDDGDWVRLPQFADAWFWRRDFAMVKRFGDESWIRLDLASGREERMPFRRLVTARRHNDNDLDRGRVVGVDADPGAPDLCCIWLLDDDWRVAAKLERVIPGPERDGYYWPSQAVEVLDRAYVVHHRNEAGADFDVVYDLAGKPLSPELDPLRILAADARPSRLLGAIRTEPGVDIYWPLHDDGTITPKPDHIAGIRVIERGMGDRTGRSPFWCGIVIGEVGGEPRVAVLAPNQWHGEAAIEALAKSDYRAVESVEYRYADPGDYDRRNGYTGATLRTLYGLIVQKVSTGEWQIVGRDGRGVIGLAYASREAAYTALAQYSKQNDASHLAESERQRKEYDYAMSWRERRVAREAEYANAVKAALQEMMQQFRRADSTAALGVARTRRDQDDAGAEAYARFVAHCAEHGETVVPLEDLESARGIAMEPALQDRLLGALQRGYPAKYPVAASVASGSGGGGSSSGGGAAAPVWSGPSVGETLNNARWNSQLNYLSGQTNSYWSSSGVQRR